MPAVTVDDLTVLPRLHDARARRPAAPGQAGDRPRRTGYEGEGFPVRRAFAGIDLR